LLLVAKISNFWFWWGRLGKEFYFRIAALFLNKILPTGSKSADLQPKGQSLNML
jgi:hypothetical protein